MNPVDYIKYLTDETNEKEKLSFYEKLNQDKKLEKEFLSVQKIWIAAQLDKINVPAHRKKQLFSEFWDKREKANNIPAFRIPKLLQYAALFILLISIPLVYFLGRNKAFTPETYTTISCSLGDKSEIVLPDSSRIILNSGSKLKFNNDFNEGERNVFLEGEAFFMVSKNEQSPFRVKTGEIEVEVLGTEFNVNAYPEENKISTTLVGGSLKVTNKNQSTLIKPGQKLIYCKETKSMIKQFLADTAPETEWKDGRLVFRNESLSDLELKLERWFDVDIDFADEEIKSKRFTGILERESILEALSYFGYSKYVGYRINGNDITFYSKK